MTHNRDKLTFYFFYSHYIKVHKYIFIEKSILLALFLKSTTTVATVMHFSSQYMITKVCLTDAHSPYAVLIGVWCLEMKQDHRKNPNPSIICAFLKTREVNNWFMNTVFVSRVNAVYIHICPKKFFIVCNKIYQ
jgi:hypothetical protein